MPNVFLPQRHCHEIAVEDPTTISLIELILICIYEGWNFNRGNYLFTTDTK